MNRAAAWLTVNNMCKTEWRIDTVPIEASVRSDGCVSLVRLFSGQSNAWFARSRRLLH
jgi:hypothetical protein